MKSLILQIKSLENSQINSIIEKRLKEFKSFENKNTNEWFSELCFCILTANSKAVTSINIQKELGFQGFTNKSQKQLSKTILRNKHRFHNNKAKYIIKARKHKNIKEILKQKGEFESREWLVQNVKGLGYKEASHFLRNTGKENVSILDRHIINLMAENNLIKKPKSLNKKSYLEIENKFNKLASNLNMSPAKLDLFMWYMKTQVVLK